MNKNVKLFGFVLLWVGTFGLLLNEFILSWGSFGTLVFAVANIVGLIVLFFSCWGKK
jgi:hypothetical protein